MRLSSYRAVHNPDNQVHALMSTVIPESQMTTYVAHDTWVSCLFIWKVFLIASQQPIASSCTDDGKDQSFITSPLWWERKDTVQYDYDTTNQILAHWWTSQSNTFSNCQLMSYAFVEFLQSVGEKTLPTTFFFLKSNKNYIFWTILSYKWFRKCPNHCVVQQLTEENSG